MNKILFFVLIFAFNILAGDTATIKLGGRYVNRVKCSTTVINIIPSVLVGTDSTSGIVLYDKDGKKWKLKVSVTGTPSFDSTGQN